jgi:tetratricopeptide (TPR) repeat protein
MTAVLSLAACGGDTHGGWWRVGLTPAAQAAARDASGETAAGSYLAGRYALETGDMRAAADNFERALVADPDDIDLRRQVFALLLGSGEFERAVVVGRQLVELDPESDEALLLLALDEARRGDHRGAVRLLESAGTAGLVGTVQPVLLAWARFGAGERAQAIAAMGADDPRSGLEQLRAYHRAMMLGLDGRLAEGPEALRNAFPELPAAPARVVRAGAQLELAAKGLPAAEALVGQARASEADDRQLEWLAAALEAGRKDVAAIQDARSGMGDALTGIAEALGDQQEGAAQALLFARLASFVTPDEGEPWLLIAGAALQQDNPEEALRALTRVPADSPVAWQAGLARARALEAADRTDEAVRLLERMAGEAPDRPDPLVAMGDLLRSKERFAEAEAAYTRAIQRLGPVERRDWRLFYARGIAYERTRRWPQAEADLLKALELEPDQPFVLNYLGYSWVDQGLNLDRAKEMLHRAVDLRPEDGYIVDSLGWAYFRLGEHDKAVTYLERAAELEPGDPVINDHLGDAYWRAGRQREARFQWERALVFKPEPDALAAIQAKLANGLPDAAPRGG